MAIGIYPDFAPAAGCRCAAIRVDTLALPCVGDAWGLMNRQSSMSSASNAAWSPSAAKKKRGRSPSLTFLTCNSLRYGAIAQVAELDWQVVVRLPGPCGLNTIGVAATASTMAGVTAGAIPEQAAGV